MRDGVSDHDYELNQLENGADFVKRGHTILEAAEEFSLDASLLQKFIQINYPEWNV